MNMPNSRARRRISSDHANRCSVVASLLMMTSTSNCPAPGKGGIKTGNASNPALCEATPKTSGSISCVFRFSFIPVDRDHASKSATCCDECPHVVGFGNRLQSIRQRTGPSCRSGERGIGCRGDGQCDRTLVLDRGKLFTRKQIERNGGQCGDHGRDRDRPAKIKYPDQKTGRKSFCRRSKSKRDQSTESALTSISRKQ